jgi:hypothetical protein
MKTNRILIKSVLILGVILTSCKNNKRTDTSETKPAKNQQETSKYPEAVDQASMSIQSYDSCQYWKKKMYGRLAKIKRIYSQTEWISSEHEERFFRNLMASQQAFDVYKKAQAELYFPAEEEEENWGSGIPVCLNEFYLKLYKQRYIDLEPWGLGLEDGVCQCSTRSPDEINRIEQLKKNP